MVGKFQALGKYFRITRVFFCGIERNVDTNALVKGFRISVGAFRAIGKYLELEEFFGGSGYNLFCILMLYLSDFAYWLGNFKR